MTWFSSKGSSRSAADRALAIGLSALAGVAGSMVLFIVAFVAWEAVPALRAVGLTRFLTDRAWYPVAGTDPQFGVMPMLVGSLLVTAGAILIAVPLGLLASLFERYYAPTWAAISFRRIVELLNGVPSVVIGYWGLVVLVPLINRWHPPGQSLLAGMLVLSLMILPTIALTSQAALRAVPQEYFRSAAALGMGRFATIRHLALPAARRGIVAGVVLAAARAVGETMAVLMVCGNVVQLPDSVFDPMRTVTANIALEMGYAGAAHRSALFVTGLLLMLLIAVAIVVVQLLGKQEPARA